MKINTHGFKMSGIKTVACMTKGLIKGWHVEIFYNLEEGKVWAKEIYGLSNFIVPHDGSIAIADTALPLSMQEIADLIGYSV